MMEDQSRRERGGRSPWHDVPLSDYEGHMGASGAGQLQALSDLFASALEYSMPESVAIVGIAGGNGLERLDPKVTRRVVGVDINGEYLEEVRRRWGGGKIPGLELCCADLSGTDLLRAAPCALVHVALVFEHTGLEGRCLERAVSLVAPVGGRFSVVLQLPAADGGGSSAVADMGYASIRLLEDDFQLIDAAKFRQVMRERMGFALEFEETTGPLVGGKALWLGIFAAG